MAEYFETKEAAVEAIRKWHKEYSSTPLFFGKIDLYGSKKWIVDYKVVGYGKAAFTVLENLTTELKGILDSQSDLAPEGPVAETSHWRDDFKAEILRFLQSPRTKNREQQTGDWWANDDLKLVVAKAFSNDVETDLLFREAQAAIDELAAEHRITGTPSGYRAS